MTLVTVEALDETDWSMIITIYVGFTVMLLSFLYFEWRCALNCCKRCMERCKGKKKDNTVQFEEGSDSKGPLGDRQNSMEDNPIESNQLDDNLNHGLDRLYAKSKKHETSYGDHGFDGHDLPNNRQN